MRLWNLTGEGRYGRYVDDAYVVAASRAELRLIIPLAEAFLLTRLGLSLSRNKIAVYSAYRGVEFLGAYLKPFLRYVGNRCLVRINSHLHALRFMTPSSASHSINSYLGITSHYAAYRIRESWIRGPLNFAFRLGFFKASLLRYSLSRRL